MRCVAALFACLYLTAPAHAASLRDSLPSLERVRIIEPGRAIDDFELTNHDGKRQRFSTLQGRVLLVAFGFTNCPDVCPTTMSRLATLQKAHPDAMRDAVVVMISVDGERDSPAALKSFLGHFSPDFVGLTGEPAALKDAGKRFAAVSFKETPDQSGHYNVAHSGQVFAVDTAGRLRAEFYNAPSESMAAVVAFLSAERD